MASTETLEIELTPAVRLFVDKRRSVGQDRGPSLTIAVNLKSALRFDMFENRPHYHYIGPNDMDPDSLGEEFNLDLTVTEQDDAVQWAVWALEEQLPNMLHRAGYPEEAKTLTEEICAKIAEEAEIFLMPSQSAA